eukprot:3308944-Pleurochrysis_carterae.AAC.5
MQGDMSQQALDSSAVLGFLRNQVYFYRQRTPSVFLSVPTAVATPGKGAYVQWSGARDGSTMGSSATQSQHQQIDHPRVTAKLREALDKQTAKREKHQSIVSHTMDFLNAVGNHNDTIMVVESRILAGTLGVGRSADIQARRRRRPAAHERRNGRVHRRGSGTVVRDEGGIGRSLTERRSPLQAGARGTRARRQVAQHDRPVHATEQTCPREHAASGGQTPSARYARAARVTRGAGMAGVAGAERDTHVVGARRQGERESGPEGSREGAANTWRARAADARRHRMSSLRTRGAGPGVDWHRAGALQDEWVRLTEC